MIDYETARAEALAALDRAAAALKSEIAGYPTPISGCDAQFNFLLAERQRIAAARRAFDEEFFVPTPRTPSQYDRIESR